MLGAALAHRRADVEGPARKEQLVQAGHGVDVDEHRGAAEAHGQHRDQGLAAGQHLALLAGAGQRGHGVVDGGRPARSRTARPSSAAAATGTGQHGYRPWKSGLRFSVKAATPSAKSALERSMA